MRRTHKTNAGRKSSRGGAGCELSGTGRGHVLSVPESDVGFKENPRAKQKGKEHSEIIIGDSCAAHRCTASFQYLFPLADGEYYVTR